MYSYKIEDIARFWEKVNKDGAIPAHLPELGSCWEWEASCNTHGYGQFGTYQNKKFVLMVAHRVSWELTNGEIPEGLFVLHKCDNRTCCNPAHLFLGTHQDNIADMMSKYRQGKKLSVDQVDEIRRRYFEEGATKRELASEMQVTEHHIHEILKQAVWK